ACHAAEARLPAPDRDPPIAGGLTMSEGRLGIDLRWRASLRSACATALAVLIACYRTVHGSQTIEASCPGDEVGWSRLNVPSSISAPDGSAVGPSAIAASSLAEGVIYAADREGLHRSDDCGASWQSISMGPSATAAGTQPFLGIVTSISFVSPRRVYIGSYFQPLMETDD